MYLQALILAGGQSTRMGERKELLHLPNGLPMYLHLHGLISKACPNLSHVHLSLPDEKALSNLQDPNLLDMISDVVAVPRIEDSISIKALFDSDHSIGPAAGLLAAYEEQPEANWLVVACDLPLIQVETICRLIREFDGPLTCYVNHSGFEEALLGIWSPFALGKLKDNVKRGMSGPRFVVKELHTKTILPANKYELFNANTSEEWDTAMKQFQCAGDRGGKT